MSSEYNLNLLEEFKKFRVDMDAQIAKCTQREPLPIQKNYWEMVRQTFPIWCEEMRQYEARSAEQRNAEPSTSMRSRSPGRSNTGPLGYAGSTGPLTAQTGPLSSGWPSWQAPGLHTVPPYQRY